ncbi:hypothetical protein GCM10025734_03370 [Kitasatospora paranensis]
MTATNDAPDRHSDTAEKRWQRIQDRIADLEQRIRETSAAATAALDSRLAHLDAIRQSLAQDPRPPRAAPGKPAAVAPRQPAPATEASGRRPAHTADRHCTTNPRQTRPTPDTPQAARHNRPGPAAQRRDAA